MSRRADPLLCEATHRRDPDRPRQAAPGLRLCPGCHAALGRHLAALPELYADVTDSLPTGGTGTGPAVSGSHGTPLPYNPRAGDWLSQVEHDVDHLVRRVVTERGLTPPRPTVPTMCGWLAPHTDWLAAHPDAGPVRDILAELVGQAYAILDPARRPLTIGPCVEQLDDGPCDGTLRATVRRDDDVRQSEIYCDSCDLTLDTTQWHKFGRRYGRAREKMAVNPVSLPAVSRA
ncbi:hypothetical protein [Spongiactinospora sp. TRM90649]|uniref:hypothetical protein n=1 Tax=Spongiactinospora sp. TRM90649 TaxID=3031114 RepID=UPI0023F66B94|nr:hypothetical protein [Spongiactinospora sp. TRM90649]MDF5758595.1 hypothetical protein [Spongiactinospora sp. TRM90649]